MVRYEFIDALNEHLKDNYYCEINYFIDNGLGWLSQWRNGTFIGQARVESNLSDNDFKEFIYERVNNLIKPMLYDRV